MIEKWLNLKKCNFLTIYLSLWWLLFWPINFMNGIEDIRKVNSRSFQGQNDDFFIHWRWLFHHILSYLICICLPGNENSLSRSFQGQRLRSNFRNITHLGFHHISVISHLWLASIISLCQQMWIHPTNMTFCPNNFITGIEDIWKVNSRSLGVLFHTLKMIISYNITFISLLSVNENAL